MISRKLISQAWCISTNYKNSVLLYYEQGAILTSESRALNDVLKIKRVKSVEPPSDHFLRLPMQFLCSINRHRLRKSLAGVCISNDQNVRVSISSEGLTLITSSAKSHLCLKTAGNYERIIPTNIFIKTIRQFRSNISVYKNAIDYLIITNNRIASFIRPLKTHNIGREISITYAQH